MLWSGENLAPTVSMRSCNCCIKALVHPVDFVAFKKPTSNHIGMHEMLLANALASAEALLQGRSAPDGEPHRDFSGNRPSTFMLFRALDPRHLGMLIALHGHRIFVQGVLWGIASFDQWGVELGKQMANALLPELKGESGVCLARCFDRSACCRNSPALIFRFECIGVQGHVMSPTLRKGTCGFVVSFRVRKCR